MGAEDFKRKLTAILSADVAGYSRLMGEDEAATVRTLAAYREVMTALIHQHRGRVVDSPGDNLLAEFASVVDAVQCAVAVQKEFQARNAELAESRRMEFRIGINLGDVIEEDDRIYGDGVNVAARLEALSDPGGICISKTAFDQIESKLPLGYEYLGEQSVKNIAKPVGAYRVLMEPRVTVAELRKKEKGAPVWGRKSVVVTGIVIALVLIAALIWNFYFRTPPMEPASVEKMAFPLPDKPSIAVLPFINMSGDADQEYIADGISENIIAALSKISEMFVIASNSTFTYKGKPVKVQQVSEDLGVRYVLEGSIQKSGDRIRVTSQLIDATTGHHLWSEQYDRDMKDLFDLQDEITHKIIVELQVKLTEGEQARVSRRSTNNLQAWSYAVRGLKLFERVSKENNAKAMELLEKAVELDPQYVWAWTRLAWTHFLAANRWSPAPAESFNKAVQIAEKAVEMDESDSDVRALLGIVYLRRGNFDKAVAEGEKAIALGPTNAQAHVLLAVFMNAVGRFEDAIGLVEKAMRLHPYYPAYYLIHLGTAYRMLGRYEDALAAYKQLLERSQRGEFAPVGAHLYLAEVYAELGREEEARAHAEELLRMDPKWSLDYVPSSTSYRFRDPAHLERRLAALRKAGLPEHPPLPLPDKPSIAVLPFENMSGDPEQEYFSDGITENIITALSKVEKLFVIARNSTFTYKGKPVKVQQVAKDLGVQYVLEGSVQRSAERIRITAQLVEAQKGHHLWAERYDRDVKDLFSLQDEITMKVITALEVKLTEGEQALVAGSGTKNLDAYLKILQARDLKRHQNVENNHKARQLAEEAIKLDPDYAQAYRWLSGTYLIDVWLGSTKSRQESLKTATELVQKALSLDDSLGGAHGLLGNLYIMRKEYDKGIREIERAVELEPNGADAHAFLGMGLKYADRTEEAIPVLRKAIRLDPHAPEWYFHVLAAAYRDIEKYGEAAEWGEKAVQQNPKNVLSRVILCSVYSLAGRMEEARIQAKELMRLDPKFSVRRFERTDPQKNQAAKKRYIDALRKAGLPD